MLRNLLDRFSGPVPRGRCQRQRRSISCSKVARPTREMLDWGEYTMKHFAALYGMTYGGMVDNTHEARALSKKLA